MERVDELSSLLHSMPSRLPSFLFSPFLSFFSRTNADNSLSRRLTMGRKRIEHSPTVPSTCFPAGIAIIQISTGSELGGLGEAALGWSIERLDARLEGKSCSITRKKRPREEWLDLRDGL